jgi:hypothetical protein
VLAKTSRLRELCLNWGSAGGLACGCRQLAGNILCGRDLQRKSLQTISASRRDPQASGMRSPEKKDCFGETPKPALETSALPEVTDHAAQYVDHARSRVIAVDLTS